MKEKIKDICTNKINPNIARRYVLDDLIRDIYIGSLGRNLNYIERDSLNKLNNEYIMLEDSIKIYKDRLKKMKDLYGRYLTEIKSDFL